MSRILDEEDLEALSYERSKAWSNLIKNCAEKDEGKAMDTRNFDEIFKEQDEDSVVDSVDEATEVCVQDELNQTTQSMTKTELVRMLRSAEDTKDILDQTLPIVEEHVRKWKEAGLDRILNTFDEQQIEEHVGGWLRRNNSVYGGNNTLLQKSPPKVMPEVYSASSSSDSEVESMHSVDTARYIRASRKRTIATASKSSIPLRTIKTYRTEAQKRAELRDKYECVEQEHRHHMQELLRRRNKLLRPKHEHTSSRLCSLNAQQRSKQLRKRRRTLPTACSPSSSSSSEDERYDGTRKSAYSYYSNQRGNCRNCHLESRLRGNDCRLCHKDRVCSNLVHIAKSTTETWIVESTGSSTTDRPKRRRLISAYQSSLRRHSRKAPLKDENIKHSKPKSKAIVESSNVEDVVDKYSHSTRLTTTPDSIIDDLPSDFSKSSNDFGIKKKRNRSMQLPVTDSDSLEDLNTTASNQFADLSSNNDLEDDDPKLPTKLDFSKKPKRMQIVDSDWDDSDDLPLQPTCNFQPPHNSTTSYYSCEPYSISSDSEDDDSHSRVSSTIECSSTAAVAPQQSSFTITSQGILLHAPDDQVEGNGNANFTLTEQVLSPIIGEGRARKLLKYHIGRRSFNSRYHVYYKPSPKVLAKLADKTEETLGLTASSCSDTDSDIFEMMGRYGVIHPVLEKCKETTT